MSEIRATGTSGGFRRETSTNGLVRRRTETMAAACFAVTVPYFSAGDLRRGVLKTVVVRLVKYSEIRADICRRAINYTKRFCIFFPIVFIPNSFRTQLGRTYTRYVTNILDRRARNTHTHTRVSLALRISYIIFGNMYMIFINVYLIVRDVPVSVFCPIYIIY